MSNKSTTKIEGLPYVEKLRRDVAVRNYGGSIVVRTDLLEALLTIAEGAIRDGKATLEATRTSDQE